ncbi:MAG: hypothetical protein ACLQM6_12695 [Acidobacteriaceae bacterium]
MTIAQYAPISGTYTGTFTGTTGLPVITGNFTVTAVINQSTTPSAGEFQVSGTLTANGTCSVSATPISGYVYGGILYAYNSATGIGITGLSTPTGSTISALFGDSNCSLGYGAPLALTRQ